MRRSYVEAWAGLGTAEVSDALDAVGLPAGMLGIRSVGDGLCFGGRAFTVRYAPAADPAGSVGDFLDGVPVGAVVAIDNGGRLDCTVWGGIMSTVAWERGISGTVIHGACRDVAVAREIGYPLFSRGRFMRTGKDRVQLEAVQEVISFGDSRVCPGDLLLGDDDGVVVVPSGRESEVLERARATHAAEERIVARVREGQSLLDARAAEGYHRLQRSEQSVPTV